MKLLKLVPDNTNIRFLRWRVPFYIISVLLIIASWTLVMTRGLNLGVDFVGGQMIRVTFVNTPQAPVAQLRSEIGRLTRAAGAPRFAYAITKTAFLLSLAFAIALNLRGLFFLIIIVPAILLVIPAALVLKQPDLGTMLTIGNAASKSSEPPA